MKHSRLSDYADENGMLTLYHYLHPSAGNPDEVTLDPQKFSDPSTRGKHSTAEHRADSTPKTFFYLHPEADKEQHLFASRQLYKARVHHKDVYDVESDPQNHAFYARGNVGALLGKIHDAGFKGLRYAGAGIDTVALLHPVKAVKTSEEAEFGKKLGAVEGLTNREEGPEAKLSARETLVELNKTRQKGKNPTDSTHLAVAADMMQEEGHPGAPVLRAAAEDVRSGHEVEGNVWNASVRHHMPATLVDHAHGQTALRLSQPRRTPSGEPSYLVVEGTGPTGHAPIYARIKDRAHLHQMLHDDDHLTDEHRKDVLDKYDVWAHDGKAPDREAPDAKLAAAQAPAGGAVVNGRFTAGGQQVERPKTGKQRFVRVAQALMKLSKKEAEVDGQKESAVRDYLAKLAKGAKTAHGTGVRSLLQARGIDTTQAITKKELLALEKHYAIPDEHKISKLPGIQALKHDQRLSEAQGDPGVGKPKIDHAVKFLSAMANKHLSDHGIDKIVGSNKLSPETRALFLHAQFAHEIAKHTKDEGHRWTSTLHPSEWYSKGVDPLHVALHHSFADGTHDPMWGHVHWNHEHGPHVTGEAPAQRVAHAVIGMTSAQRDPVDNALTTHKLIDIARREAAKHGSKNWVPHLPEAQIDALEAWTKKHAEHVARLPRGKDGKSRATPEQLLKWRESLPKGAAAQGKVGFQSLPAAVHPETGKVLGFAKVGSDDIKHLSEAAKKAHEDLKARGLKPRIVNQFPVTNPDGSLKAKAWTTANDAFLKNLRLLKKLQAHVQEHHMLPKSHHSYSDPSHPEYKGQHAYDHDSIRALAAWLDAKHPASEFKKATGHSDLKKALPDLGGYHKGKELIPGANVFGAKMGSFIANMNGDQSQLTHDVWHQRLGDMVQGKKKVKDSPSTGDRKPNYDAAHRLTEDDKLPPAKSNTVSGMQAHLWNIAQTAGRLVGADTDSKDFIDAANKIHERIGASPRFSRNAQLMGGSYRAKDLDRTLSDPKHQEPERLSARSGSARPHTIYVSANDRDENTTFDDVPHVAAGDAHRRLAHTAAAHPEVTGVHDAVGSWKDGQEPSRAVRVDGATGPKRLRQIAAHLGSQPGDNGRVQKAVIAFQAHEGGPDALHVLHSKSKDLRALHAKLQNHGIEFQTFVPHHDGTRIEVVDFGKGLADKIGQFHGEPTNEVTGHESHEGTAHYIGGDTRDEGAAAYARELEEPERLSARPRADNAHSWIDPEGNVHPIAPYATHQEAAIRRHGLRDSADAKDKGWQRVVSFGKELWAEGRKLPSQKQRDALETVRAASGLRRILHDGVGIGRETVLFDADEGR